jgi:hypothetical protein
MAAMGQELLAIAGGAGRVCVGLVFLLAAAQKFSHWKILSGVVANYRLLPAGLVGPVSALLPPAEMIVGLLLLAGVAQYGAAMDAIEVLMLFATGMVINLRRGRDKVKCGGGHVHKQTLSWAGGVTPGWPLYCRVLDQTGPTPSAVRPVLAFFMLYLLPTSPRCPARPAAFCPKGLSCSLSDRLPVLSGSYPGLGALLARRAGRVHIRVVPVAHC